jgi:hypothetical protein
MGSKLLGKITLAAANVQYRAKRKKNNRQGQTTAAEPNVEDRPRARWKNLLMNEVSAQITPWRLLCEAISSAIKTAMLVGLKLSAAAVIIALAWFALSQLAVYFEHTFPWGGRPPAIASMKSPSVCPMSRKQPTILLCKQIFVGVAGLAPAVLVLVAVRDAAARRKEEQTLEKVRREWLALDLEMVRFRLAEARRMHWSI